MSEDLQLKLRDSFLDAKQCGFPPTAIKMSRVTLRALQNNAELQSAWIKTGTPLSAFYSGVEIVEDNDIPTGEFRIITQSPHESANG